MALRKLNKQQIIQLLVGAFCICLFFFFAGEKFIKSSSIKKLQDPKEVTSLSNKLTTKQLLQLKVSKSKDKKIASELAEKKKESERLLLGDQKISKEEMAALRNEANSIKGDKSETKDSSFVKFPGHLSHEEKALETRLEELRNNNADLDDNLLNNLLTDEDEPISLKNQTESKQKETEVSEKEFKVINKKTSNELEKPFADLLRESEEKASPENLRHKKFISALLKRLYTLKGVEQLKVGMVLREDVKETDAMLLSELLKQGVVDRTAKLFIIDALAKTKSKDAVNGLIFEYEKSKERGRVAIVSALSKIGTRKAELFLFDVMSGKVPVTNNVLQSTYAAMSRIETTSSRQMLEALERNEKIKKFPANYHALKSALKYARKKSELDKIDSGMPGGSKLTLKYKGSEYLFYHPALRDELSATPWLFVCVHGSDMNVQKLFDSCLEAVKGKNIAVLVPVFDSFNFPDYGNLDYLSQTVRSDQRFFEIIDHVTKVARLQTREMYIFGAEKGGDFVSRIALLYPKRFAKAVSYNAVFPRPNKLTPLPEGVQPSPLLPGLKVDLPSFVKSDFLAQRPDVIPRDGKLFFKWLERVSTRTGRAVRPKIESIKVDEALNYKLNSRAKEFIFGG